jgi:transcriptional regulator with XRE-family HTH domain
MNGKFGVKLRRLREINGFSQEAVAHHCGISQAAYSKKERGERIPSYERLCQLSDLYDIEIRELTELPLDELLIIVLKKKIDLLISKAEKRI